MERSLKSRVALDAIARVRGIRVPPGVDAKDEVTQRQALRDAALSEVLRDVATGSPG